MTIKKISLGVILMLLLLVAIVLLRTFTLGVPNRVQTLYPQVTLNEAQISQHLSEAVQFKTVSKQNPLEMDYKPFSRFIDWMSRTYQPVHEHLERITINQYTLLYKWQGEDDSLAPILLSGHYDVVPVLPGTERAWKHPAFAGVVDDTHIWGRGTLDDKCAVVAMMEALNTLVEHGFTPKRTIYVAATHDEEIGSKEGAAGIVKWMQQRNIKPLWSLDEGSFVLNGLIPGVDKPVASINVAEKGYLNLELSVESQGGHSSMPKGHTAVGILASAIHRLQNNPLHGALSGISGDMFDSLVPDMPFIHRVLFSNKWLFSGLINSKLSETAAGNAMLRTTTAPTMFSGSVKANILPVHGKAIVNFRLHPRDSSADVVKHVTLAVNDPRVTIRILDSQEASHVSNHRHQGFEHIAQLAQHLHGPVVVAPGLTVAATDSREYDKVTEDSYRFNPMSINAEDVAGFHGTNERLSIRNLIKATQFYYLLIKTAS